MSSISPDARNRRSHSRSPANNRRSRASVSPVKREDTTNAAPTSCRLFVGNLPYTTKESDYLDLVGSAGKYVRAELLSAFGRPKGCGIVEYEDIKGAEAAMERLNGTDFNGRSIFVKEVGFL